MEELRRKRDRVERAANADGMKLVPVCINGMGQVSIAVRLRVAAGDLIGSNGTQAGDHRAGSPSRE
jgi:hypothetical protein